MDSENLDVSYSYEEQLDPNIFYKTDEVRALTNMKVPYRLYIKDKATWDRYNNVAFDRVTIKSLTDSRKLVSCSKELLESILKDVLFFTYTSTITINGLFKSILNQHDSAVSFSMAYVSEDGKLSAPITYKRTELIRLLEEAVKQYPDEFDAADVFRLNTYLKANVLPITCKRAYAGEIETFIDGKKYVIDSEKLFSLLKNDYLSNDEKDEELDVKNLNDFIDGKLKITYKVIDQSGEREESDSSIVAYILKEFIDKNRIFDRFLFSQSVINRYNEMVNKQLINFQTLEKYNRSLDEDVSDKYEINEKLIEEAYKYINPTYNDLEKAIHIYIRLCQILSLDDEMNNYKLNSSYKINKIKDKNVSNNKITRYQFMLIYSKFLDSLGIKYSNYSVGNPDDIRLGFKYGEYDIEINEFGYLSSDISNIKLNNSIECLKSINKNATSRLKFSEMKDKVKDNITVNKKKDVEFEFSLEEYRKKFLTPNILTNDDLYRLFFMALKKEDLVGLDSYAYLKQLFDKTLGKTGEVKLDFISKKRYKGFSFKSIALLTREVNGNFTYAIIDYNQNPIVKIISKEHLEKILESNNYHFLNEGKKDLSSYGLESKDGSVENVRKIKINM